MAGLSIWHVLIFAIVVILLFGTSKLKNLGKDVGVQSRTLRNLSVKKKKLRQLNFSTLERLMRKLKPVRVQSRIEVLLCSILE